MRFFPSAFKKASRVRGSGIIPLAVEPVSGQDGADAGPLAVRGIASDLCYFRVRGLQAGFP